MATVAILDTLLSRLWLEVSGSGQDPSRAGVVNGNGV